MSEEWLDIVDQNGNPTGEKILREDAHRTGILHRTSHVWLYRIKNKKLQILLQMRAADKDSRPCCWDISSAGHIPAGDDYLMSAQRELQEELGITCAQSAFHEVGVRKIHWEGEFFGKPFKDHQITKVFVVEQDLSEEEFLVQREEVEKVQWFTFEEIYEAVQNNAIKHCIYLEELDMIYTSIFKLANF